MSPEIVSRELENNGRMDELIGGISDAGNLDLDGQDVPARELDNEGRRDEVIAGISGAGSNISGRNDLSFDGGLARNLIKDPLRRLEAALLKWTGSQLVPEFNFRKVTLAETVKLISRLGNSSSSGQDRLDATFLKLVLPSISGPMMHIINESLEHSTWANKWKIGKVFPLLKDKKMDRLSPASYRPVCILPTVSKVVERAAQVQLQDFFESSGQLNQGSTCVSKGTQYHNSDCSDCR